VEGSFVYTTYDTAGGTAAAPDVEREGSPHAPPDLIAWLQSEQAQRYAGLWVFLEDWQPGDSDLSPSALLERHRGQGNGVMVFVEPRDIQIEA
jgi:hypothetical protein